PYTTLFRSWEARTTTDRLDEPGTVGGDHRIGPKDLEGHSRNDDRLRAQAEGRRADESAAPVAGFDDRAVLYFDPRRHLVRLAEPVGVPETSQITRREAIRRRLVV